MKKLLMLFTCIVLSYALQAQEKINVTFKYIFINSNEGFTYDSKLILERNGTKVGESKVKNQEKLNETTFIIPKGNATLKATIYALYNGKWEARTDANGYSFDCIYEKKRNWDKNTTINMTVDIATNTVKIDEEDNKVNNNITYNNTDKTKSNYQTELQALNNYLKTFDNGYYGYFEVKDGYIYMRFKAGKYNKFKMEDMEGAEIQENYNRVIFKCKYGSECISTDWKVNGKEEYTQFTNGSYFNYQELADLLNNFKNAYLGITPVVNNNTNNNSQSSNGGSGRVKPNSNTNNDEDNDVVIKSDDLDKYKSNIDVYNWESSTALSKLNEYLKTFNSETYRAIEVKDGKVYFGFALYDVKYNSSIPISDLKNKTSIIITTSKTPNEVRINCNNDSDCFYSTYSNGYTDHFRFFSYSVKDLTKMQQLLNDFIKAL